MTEPKTDHFREAESYLLKLDDLEPADAYVAVIAAQAHATLAQGAAAAEMVGLQKMLLTSMQPPVSEQPAPTTDFADKNDKPIEPMQFGSVVRAKSFGPVAMLWQRCPDVADRHYWESETGATEAWQNLTDVEVLRVGIGETHPHPAETYRQGREDFAYDIRKQLDDLYAAAITAPEKRCYNTALAIVAALLGES